MQRMSPVVVAGNRVLTLTKDFELGTGNEITPEFERTIKKDEYGSFLKPVFRRLSSDRQFLVEIAYRDPGKTWPGLSFEMCVVRAADGTQVGRNITCPGFFGDGCAADVESRGKFVLLGDPKSVRVFRVETGEVETTMPVPIKRVDAVAFSPDQEWLVVSDLNDLHFWRWRDQAPVKTIHAGRKIDSLTFNPDGQYLAEGPDVRNDIQIRDMRTLEIVASLTDEVDSPLMVSSMDISPNGRFLVAHNEVSVDQEKLTIPHRVHVWDLKTRQPVFQIATGEWVRSVAFSDDGRRIVGEFSGAAHGALLAAWKLPDDVLDRNVEPESDAKVRLGDGIQWSMWGDKKGWLSGSRLILPNGGLKAGEPLEVEYRLANVSSETQTIQCFLNSGMRFASLGSGNRFGGFGLGRQAEAVTPTLKPGEVFVDTEHLVSIGTTGLQPGEYQVALGSAFFYPDESDKNITHEIPHRGSIPVALLGDSTVKIRELPKSDIHWGNPLAGLQFGARWFDHQRPYTSDELVEADLFVANVTDRPVEVSVQLPHPGDGWLFNVEDRDGSSSMFVHSSPIDFWSPQRSIHLKLAPGEVAPITGDGIPVSFLQDAEPSVASLPRAKFQIVSSKGEATQVDPDHTVNGKLVSQGGDYSAVFQVTVLRPDIPALRLDLTTVAVPFVVTMPVASDDSVSAATNDAAATTAQQTQKMEDDDESASPSHYEGSVLDPNGKPLSGAELFVISDWDETIGLGHVRAVSDAEGKFSFDAPDMTWQSLGKNYRRGGLIVAKKQGFVPEWMETWGDSRGKFRNGLWGTLKKTPVELQLVRSDTPIRGQLIDVNNKPLAGARVRLTQVMVPRDRDLTAFLEHWSKTDISATFMTGISYKRSLNSHFDLLDVKSELVTDADGRFELSGVGRDRLVSLEITSPSSVTTSVNVMTRDAENVGILLNGVDGKGKPTQTIYGANFTFTPQPGLTVSGVVRDRETKQPVAGMWVKHRGYDPFSSPDKAKDMAVTDANGRFTITGLNPQLLTFKPEHRDISAIPQPGTQYVRSDSTIDNDAEMIIETVRGIHYRMTVVDEVGHPVEASVHYVPINPNYVNKDSFPAISSAINHAALRADGTYEGFVVPGPGAILVTTPGRRYRSTFVDPKEFFAPGQTFEGTATQIYGTLNTLAGVSTSGQGVWIDQRDYAAIVLVNPAKDAEPLQLSATLIHDTPRSVLLIDLDGNMWCVSSRAFTGAITHCCTSASEVQSSDGL